MKTKIIILVLALFCTSAYAQRENEAKIVQDILNLPENELYTKGRLAELGQLVTSRDEAFRLYYPDGSKVDSAVGKKDEMKRSSAFIVARVIIEEEIIPVLNKGQQIFYWQRDSFSGALAANRPAEVAGLKPDWKGLEKKIRQKYGAGHASRAVLWAKMDFYRLGKQYDLLTETFLLYMKKCSIRVYDLENQVAWEDVFGHVTDRELLSKTAEAYGELLVKADQVATATNFLDTYANLLYKAGKTGEAIAWQKKAVELTKGKRLREELSRTLVKMEKGLPTWPEQK